MGKKCIVIDACQFTPPYNYSLLNGLAKAGHSIVYATTRFAHGYVPDPEGVNVLCCFFFLARLAAKFSSSGSLRRILRAIEYPFDSVLLVLYILLSRIRVVHFMWVVWPDFDLLIIKILKLFRCRIVYTAHNPFPHEQKPADIAGYAKIYQAADRIIALTAYTRSEILKHTAVPPDRIAVIVHGDYDVLFSKYGFNNDLARAVRDKAANRRIAGFLGGIRPYKGLDYFIEAMPLAKQKMPDVFFLVAGSAMTDDAEKLKQKIAENCRPDDIWQDIRFLPTEDMKAYLSVINVLVQPYVSASQSGNTVMAYSAGVPVISTDVGGLGEMTADGVTGYVIAPRNPGAIAEAVVKCLRDDNYYRQLSANAKKVAHEKYGWDIIAQQTARVYFEP